MSLLPPFPRLHHPCHLPLLHSSSSSFPLSLHFTCDRFSPARRQLAAPLLLFILAVQLTILQLPRLHCAALDFALLKYSISQQFLPSLLPHTVWASICSKGKDISVHMYTRLFKWQVFVMYKNDTKLNNFPTFSTCHLDNTIEKQTESFKGENKK